MSASIQLPGGLKVLNPQPEITKYFNNSGTPYTSTSEVLSQLSSGIRHIGLTVNINNVEYWFQNGILDTDLVVKMSEQVQVDWNEGLTSSAAYIKNKPDLSVYQPINQKNQSNGYPGLVDGKIDVNQLPDSVVGNVKFQGLFNPNTDVFNPTASNLGWYYIISADGTYSTISFNIGDWIISEGTFLSKVDNSDALLSFNGRIGNIVLNSDDVSSTFNGKLYTNSSNAGELDLYKKGYYQVITAFAWAAPESTGTYIPGTYENLQVWETNYGDVNRPISLYVNVYIGEDGKVFGVDIISNQGYHYDPNGTAYFYIIPDLQQYNTTPEIGIEFYVASFNQSDSPTANVNSIQLKENQINLGNDQDGIATINNTSITMPNWYIASDGGFSGRAANADYAYNASYADSAGNASNADNASYANNAGYADNATNADHLSVWYDNGEKLLSGGSNRGIDGGLWSIQTDFTLGGMYLTTPNWRIDGSGYFNGRSLTSSTADKLNNIWYDNGTSLVNGNISRGISTLNWNIDSNGDITTTGYIIKSSTKQLGLGTTSPTNTITIAQGVANSGIAIYNTSDQTTNYARYVMRRSSNAAYFENLTQIGGSATKVNLRYGVYTDEFNSGGSRLFDIYHTNTTDINVGSPAHFLFGNGGTYQPGSQIGLKGYFQGTASTQNDIGIISTVNQTGTAKYRGLFIAPYISATGSGGAFLIEAGTLDQNAGSFNTAFRPAFSVDTNGNTLITSIGGITSPNATNGKILHIYNNLNDGTIASNSTLLVESVNRNSNILLRKPASGNGALVIQSNDGNTTYGGFYVFQNGANQDVTIQNGSNARISFYGSGATDISSIGNTNMNFYTNGSNRFQINGAGEIGVNTSPQTGYGMYNFKTMVSSSGAVYAANPSITSTVVNGYGFQSVLNTATGVTTSSYAHFFASQGTLLSSPAVQYGYLVSSGLTSGTTNYGFYGNIASGTGRWNIFMNGTANNYLNGNLGLGTTLPTHNLTLASGVSGIALYNTTDQTTNYERGVISWNNSYLQFGSNFGGTASTRSVRIYSEIITGGVQRQFDINSSNSGVGNSHFLFNNGGTGQLGSSVGIQGSFTGGSGIQQNAFSIIPSVAQTSTASFKGIWVSPYFQTQGTGGTLLMDLGTNTAGGAGGTHTLSFSVNTVGKITLRTGANTSVGQAILVAGTVTISNTQVTASSLIYITRGALNATSTVGHLGYTSSAGTFTINSYKSNITIETGDLSTINWWIIN